MINIPISYSTEHIDKHTVIEDTISNNIATVVAELYPIITVKGGCYGNT